MTEPDEVLVHSILLTGVLAASPDCIEVLGSDGIVLFMNARGLALYEFSSPDKILGKSFVDRWPLEVQDEVRRAIRGAAVGCVTQFEAPCSTTQGRPRWWEVRLAPVPATANSPLRLVGISRDSSESRAARMNARSNEEKFALLLDSSGDGIYGMALDGSCIFINPAGSLMLGYEPSALIGLSLNEIIHHGRPDGSLGPIAPSEIQKAAQSGSSHRIDDEVFWHKDGHPIPVTYSVFPMLVDGKRTGTVVTFSDITERRRVEHGLRRFAAELSEADRRKTEFLATLAHELRNPLAPLRTGLELLAKASDRPEAFARVREMMQRQLGQMVHLINDLLDIARITSGKMELKVELAELGRIVRNAVEASTPAINAGGHTIAVDVPQGSMLLQADVTRLTQVLSNILNNAAKYTPPGGHIDLRARRASDFVEIDIVDNGMGIAPGSLSAIFEMFTQVGRDVHAVPGGLGIGLNLVRRLVELHGGFVSAQSAGVGLGSTFTVRLPLAMTPTKALVRETQVRSSSAALRILVVDDNMDASESLAMLLRFGDHETRTAGGGKEALEILAEFPSDVVILDIGMPVLNGYELAREIRKLSGFERVTLIALTGWGGEGDRKRSEAAGFDGHLTKPVAFEELERLLARVKTIAAT